ncbi:MAG TPA: EAL domain-containing protein, partial [Thermodesulfobacteriota bacterium]|nr:EAL domain-containing protein [Thermodesulfobacteriota bacterium]
SGAVLYANESAAKSFGYAREEIGRLNVKAFTPDVDTDRIIKENTNATGGWSGEVVAVRKNGEEFPAVLSASLVRDSTARPIAMMGVFRDITERKASEERIVRMAYYDALTGLPNRSLFLDRLFSMLPLVRRHGHRAAVLFIDLDQFKVINDTMGHAAGDELLKSVAERLKTIHREYDTVARFGGDEFIILVHDLDGIECLGTIVEKIFASFKAPFLLKDHEIHVTPSMGVSVYPDDGEDAETLVKNADIAMYRAKDDGRNNYKLYTPAMNTRTFERLRLTNELHRAIEKEEFVLHYQPQIECRSGAIVGVEALVRWNRPASMVPPSEFIPLAEETGLIVPLGEWILRTACTEIRTWQTLGLKDARVAVNISARQFKHPEFIETVGSILRETGIEPCSVELELTESMIMEKAERSIEWLRRLKDMGLKITIDDFGTGYSCLEYLKRMPIDMLKIDAAFVKDITTDADDASIAIAIIRVAHSMKLEVVAEGVETAEQFKFLKGLLCDKAQGYLFSRPLPADECMGLLRKGPVCI